MKLSGLIDSLSKDKDQYISLGKFGYIMVLRLGVDWQPRELRVNNKLITALRSLKKEFGDIEVNYYYLKTADQRIW